MNRSLHLPPGRTCVNQWCTILFCFSLFFLPCISAAQLSVSFEVDEPTCDDPEGSIVASPTGGTQPYAFVWNTGAETSSITLTQSGTYQVTVTDADGEWVVRSIELMDILGGLQVQGIVENVSCPGESDGSICLGASGGMLPYTFEWSTGDDTQNTLGLDPGDYTVTVTDNNGCQVTATYTIDGLEELSIAVETTDVSCFGLSDGAASATVSGGTGPYKLKWSTGTIADAVEGLSSGDYGVTVIDANGCMQRTNFTISSPDMLRATLETSTVACNGEPDGSATITATGGTAPYSYEWNTGATSQTISGLGSGNYSVTITDANNCRTVRSGTVEVDTDLDLGLQVDDITDCSNDSEGGSASLDISGGTAPYDIEWSTGNTDNSIDDLSKGDYSVTVTDDAGCSVSGFFSIKGNGNLRIDFEGGDIICGGTDFTTVTANVTGGTPPYQYSWNTGETTDAINTSVGGVFTVSVTDNFGCRAVRSIEVKEASSLTIDIMAMDVTCAGGSNGSLWASVSGGKSPVSFEWNTGDEGQDIEGLEAGTYTVTATDANGCSITGEATITAPEESLSVEVVLNADACSDKKGISATAEVEGGAGPYKIIWSSGQLGETISGLQAGEYSVQVIDDLGCMAMTGFTVDDELAGPLWIDFIEQPPGCDGDDGSISAEVMGGAQPYSYEWSTGETSQMIVISEAGTYTVTVTDANGCRQVRSSNIDATDGFTLELETSPADCAAGNNGSIETSVTGGSGEFSYTWSNGASSSNLSNLKPGTYSVTVTDKASGCTATASAEVTGSDGLTCELVVLQQPGEGNDGEVTVEVDGGTEPLTYEWNTGATSQTISGLAAGTYSVTVTSANGCSTECSVALTTDSECVQLTDAGEIAPDQEVCGPGAQADPIISVRDASGPEGTVVEYLWMKSTVSADFNPGGNWRAIPNSNSPTLDPGRIYETTYFMRCARSEGCGYYIEPESAVTITVGDEAVAEITGPDFVCENETVTFSAASAGPGARIEWDFGPSSTPRTSTEETVEVTYDNFGARDVILQVSANGCTSQDIARITVSRNPVICGSPFVIDAETMDDQGVMLSWELDANEVSYRFVIEHASDGKTFREIAQLREPREVKEGFNYYEHYDDRAKRGWNYYRVKLVDTQGNTVMSGIEKVALGLEAEGVIAYPNPAFDDVTVEFSGTKTAVASVRIMSADGRLLENYRYNQRLEREVYDFQRLPAGVYFFRIQFADDDVQVLRVVRLH